MTASRATIAIALALLTLPATAAGAGPSPALTDLEDEVMCPICGTLLELSEAPQAQRQRALIAALIERGRTKEEIKDALVAEYGDEVLAVPEGSGFELSAYLVPAIAFLLAAVAIAIGIVRWRGRGSGGGEPGGRAGRRPTEEEAERLDADLARYDL
jgi:cytochrome c-type biogenesis protein CcmH/NrfF